MFNFKQYLQKRKKKRNFVGRKGAVRAGKTASSSFLITDRIKAMMAKEMVGT